MNRLATILSSLFVCGISCLLFAAGAFAAEEGGQAVEGPTEIFKWVNFALVAAALLWLYARTGRPWFKENAAAISSAISKAHAAKAEADRALQDAEERLARLEDEVRLIRAEAEKDAAAEAERIRGLVQSDLEKVQVAAKAEIEAAERAARLELKALAAKLAVDSAESLVVKQLTVQTQDALVAGFVKSLAGSPN